ncbi:MAG: YdcF family protein [Pyrinomonadaceae bacterium]
MLLFFLFAAGVWIFLAPFLAERLIVERPLEKAEAILVLSGSSVYRERTRKAAEVYRAGVAPKIFLTDDGERAGWSNEEKRNPPYADLARRALIEMGVPADAIEILPGEVAGTIDEARLFGQKAKENGWRSVLLITSAYHTRRTLFTFEKVFNENGLEVGIGVESAPVGEQTPPALYWWLTPRGWRFVAGEYVKGFYYYLFY